MIIACNTVEGLDWSQLKSCLESIWDW